MANKIEKPAWAPDNIGKILKDLRYACGIKNLHNSEPEKDFIREIIVSPQILQRIESGKRNPSIYDIEDIIGALIHTTGDKLKEVTTQPKFKDIPVELKYIINQMYTDWDYCDHNAENHVMYYRSKRIDVLQ